MRIFKLGAAVAALGFSFFAADGSFAQSGFSDWYYFNEAKGVSVYYAVRVDRDEIRVAWKCVNETDTARACSVGAGDSKSYYCRKDGEAIGFTTSLGERATVNAKSEYAFPSDFACRGLGATEVRPSVRISIED